MILYYTMEFVDHYIDWIKSRVAGIKKYIPDAAFQSKTLLELGSGHGKIGHAFHSLGAIVTSSDARKEYVEYIKQTYPHLDTVALDADKDTIPKKYDIIVHWGVLYHLAEIEEHLEDVSKNCDILLLETEVYDSDEDHFYMPTHEAGFDQAFHGIGIRPTQNYVERLLREYGFNVRCIKDPILNTDVHRYDWKEGVYGSSRVGARRFWICWKNVECPIREGL